MKLTLKSGNEGDSKKEYSESSNFSDILHTTSKYYFENGLVDVYNKHIIYYDTHLYEDKDKQNELYSFFKTDSEFMPTLKNNWLLILKELKDKSDSRRQLWLKLSDSKSDNITKDFKLFYLLMISDFRLIFTNKLIKFLEQELNIQFVGEDPEIKVAENTFVISKGEPWIKITVLDKGVTSEKIENFFIKLIEETKDEFKNFTLKSDVIKTKTIKSPDIELSFKKLYPYESSRNDIAYVLTYNAEKKNEEPTEYPIIGLLYSEVRG